MNFVVIIPDKVTRGAGSVKILESCGAGLIDDVINRVKRKIHSSNLFSLFLEYSITEKNIDVKLNI